MEVVSGVLPLILPLDLEKIFQVASRITLVVATESVTHLSINESFF